MLKRITYTLALGGALIASVWNGIAETRPYTRAEYLEMLEPAKKGNALVSVAPENPSPHIQCGSLDVHIEKVQAQYPNWNFVRLPLRMYAGDNTNSVANQEREDAASATDEVFDFRPALDPLPQYFIIDKGKVLGYGACTTTRDGITYLQFAPKFNPNGDERPIRWIDMIECLSSVAAAKPDSRTYFSLEQADRCVAHTMGSVMSVIETGRRTHTSLYNPDSLHDCFAEAITTTGDLTVEGIEACLQQYEIGNNPVRLETVLEEPRRAVSCSQRSKKERGFQESCGDIVLNK